MSYRAGTVAVVGRPNVGKSTLVNHIVGAKVSIVSDKAQTTRRNVMGIATRPDWQIAFVDTPGIHRPQNRMGSALNEAARSALRDVDAVLVVVNVGQDPHEQDRRIAQMMEQEGLIGPEKEPPVLLCLNKMDLLRPQFVEPRWDEFHALFQPREAIMTCFTRKANNVDLLEQMLVRYLPEQERLFDEEMYTDQSLRSMVGEIVRERALRRMRQEVPHALMTYVENWDEDEETGRITIGVVLLCETEGQKAILIGKGGSMLKAIGTEARLEIAELTEQRVHLDLFVRVRNDWRQDERILRELDLI